MPSPTISPVLPALIAAAIRKFHLSLRGRTVLTEGATGHFVVTSVVAASAGADVFALTRASRHGSVADVEQQTEALRRAVSPDLRIRLVTSLDQVPLERVDVVTNTGFVRPIDAQLIARLPRSCVIPLMWETWEFRPAELDLEACRNAGIKVYGTNEDDVRLRTREYLGFVVLERLLTAKRTPFSSTVLILGSTRFVEPVETLLSSVGYRCAAIRVNQSVRADSHDVIVLLEHENPTELVGGETALIRADSLRPDQMVIHVCGRADFSELRCEHVPARPAPFGAMSFTADHADPKAVVDLHTAGLSVAEGMLEANARGLSPEEYKHFMEMEYPAQAFDDRRFW